MSAAPSHEYEQTPERKAIVGALLAAEGEAVRAARLLDALGQTHDAHACRNIAQGASARREVIELGWSLAAPPP